MHHSDRDEGTEHGVQQTRLIYLNAFSVTMLLFKCHKLLVYILCLAFGDMVQSILVNGTGPLRLLTLLFKLSKLDEQLFLQANTGEYDTIQSVLSPNDTRLARNSDLHIESVHLRCMLAKDDIEYIKSS